MGASRPRDIDLGVGPRRPVVSVALQFHPTLSAGKPTPRWDFDELRVINDGGPYYDLLPDGSMLAIQKGEDEVDPRRAEVIVNFFEMLRGKEKSAR